MGVKGINPFLERYCPDVLTKLPRRFRSLGGKRVVLDGTLITQRFHFARLDHPYRHVLGWYKLARELRENDVSAICVFDGKERSAAKAQEVQRRTALRLTAVARSSIEKERFQRLYQLKEDLDLYQGLTLQDKQEFTKALQESPLPEEDTSKFVEPDLGEEGPAVVEEHAVVEEPVVVEGPAVVEEPPSVVEEPVVEEETTVVEGPAVAVVEKPVLVEIPAIVEQAEEETPLTVGDEGSLAPLDISQLPRSYLPPSPNKLAAQFRDLYLGHKASVAKFVWVDRATAQLTEPPDAVIEDKQNEVTKNQHNLAMEEEELWSKLAKSLAFPTPDLRQIAENYLTDLVRRSQVLFSSFDRRVNKPQKTTYDQSMDILRAMGIPCIEATGAVEAEGLASAMVLEGHADFVGSEDTDVLVYGVPLLKNVTSPYEPLALVSGPDIRISLGLTQAAYVDLALLMGTDFTDRIRNLGPVTAYKFIKKYGSIECILEAIQNEPRYALGDAEAYLARVNIARQLFTTPPPLPPVESLRAIDKNDEAVEEILSTYGLVSALEEENWNYDAAYETFLGGNYFDDSP
ncbi:PIN domain-like protein [Gymnopilus junonius]|uniref:Exonuclease 1 n=1 Tax=Gymnopilus junonius TaxID=109634 RepID=A0A9P5NI67_GYMJU|nr:PIN domain-like protein [Gymnopilus junonius]